MVQDFLLKSTLHFPPAILLIILSDEIQMFPKKKGKEKENIEAASPLWLEAQPP